MKLSCPFLLTQHLLFFSFYFSRRGFSMSWVITTAHFVLTFSLFYSIPSCALFADFLLVVIFCPCCPPPSHGCGHCWHHCQLSWGIKGSRGRGGMFDLQLGLCLSLAKLHLFHLHSEPPEEEGKWGTMKLQATRLVLPFLAHQWLEMQKKLIKIVINSNSSRNRWTPIPSGCGAFSLRSCLISWPESKACL